MTNALELSAKYQLLLEKRLRQQGVATAPRPVIPRRSGTGPSPLSFGQQRLWFLYQLDPDALTFNLPEGVRLSGPLDAGILRRAFGELLRRHESLRTLFGTAGGEPVQIVIEEPEPPMACADLSGLPAEARLGEARRLGSLLVARPFDLTRSLPLRSALLRLGGEDHALVLIMHHIASDAWSMGILVRELTALYDALAAGKPSPLPELPIQYADFATWQRDQLQGETLEALLRYWRDCLAGAPTSLALPSDRPRPAVQSSRGGTVRLTLDPGTTTAIRELALSRGSSLFMLLMAAFGVLLHRSTNAEDLLVGTPVAGRTRRELEPLIGFFINMLAIRIDLAGDPPFPELLERVRERILQAEAHQELPFESLVRDLSLPRDLSQTPLFQVALAFQNLSGTQPSSPGSPAPFSVETQAAQYDLHLVMNELPQRISGTLIYRADLFEESSAARLARSFETLVQGIASRGGLAVSELPLLTGAERQQLISGWNRFGVQPGPLAPLHELFAAAARRAPQAEALSGAGVRWSYLELEAEANRIAWRLHRLGAGLEMRVALCLERSPEMIAAILAILRVGAAYVPLDPDLPRERLGFLLADSGAAVLLTHSSLEMRLPEIPGLPRLLLDAGLPGLDAESPVPFQDAAVDPGHAAYVIYTSGSTGLPKGVVVTHANVSRLLAATQDRFAFGPGDVWTLFHSHAFDFSVWEIWGALAWGGRLVIVPYWISRSPEAFLDLLESERVTVLNQTPSAFRQLSAADAERPRRLSLRTVVFGGEALEPSILASWFERHGDREPLLVNMYGITETTVHVTYRPMSHADLGGGSRIGLPIEDLQVHVLDRRLEPVPFLVPGEIHVGGPGVARGYLNRPELTAERFVADPFSPEPGARLYRSGDLARRRPDGELEYLGRTDDQVKVRGFRIELGEIQAALMSHPDVREAVVLSRGRGGDHGRLVAWFVSREARIPTIAELRAHLEQRLPSYMIPPAFVPLDGLPLTPNGKLDRKALPDPDPATARAEVEHVAPETPAERILAQVWSEVLGVAQVGSLDNFFALGGDSILSIRVLARARDLGLSMTLQQIFQHQILGELARVLSTGEPETGLVPLEPFELISEADRRLLPGAVEDAYPLARTQAGMLFHTQLNPGTAVYHDIVSERLRGPFDEDAFHRSLARAVARHPALRTAFELRETSEPLQLVYRHVTAPLAIEDLRGLSEPERERTVAAWLEAERYRDFDWSCPPLLRFHVHRLADDVFQHTLSFHHSVLDGWSAATLRTELFHSYMAMAEGRELPEEPPPAAAFRDSVRLEREALASAETRAFWQRLLAEAPPNRLPRWPHVRPAAPRANDHFVPVDSEATEALRQAARQTGVPLKSLLFAAHLAVVARVCGEPDVVTGLVVHGRPEQEGGTEALGLFLNTVPFRLRLGGETWSELARKAFELERDMLAHRRLPLGEIQSAAGGQEMFETAFGVTQFHVYQEVRKAGGLQSLSNYGYEETNFPLGTNCTLDIEGAWISLRLNYSDAEVSPEQVRAVGACYAQALAALAAHPERPHHESSLLSEEEQRQVLTVWSDGGPASPRVNAARLFEERARTIPEEVAVAGDDSRLTYGELDRRANQVARALRLWGVGPEVPVAVCLDRSPDLLIGLLAIWKAGGAYVALDPAYPLERLLLLLKDSQAAVLLTTELLLESLPSQVDQIPILRLDGDVWLIDAQEDSPLPETADAESSAYLIYTSGSTGAPKGVVVPHGGLGNLAAAQTRLFDVRPGDRVLQFASLSFDASVSEILMALLGGAELHLSSPSRLLPGPGLIDLLAERRITHLTLPPSVLAVLPEAGLPDLRVLVVAGEACPSELVRRWSGGPGGRRVIDAYGPTEATVCATAGDVSSPGAEGGRPRIGPPIDGVRVLVLDSWLQPAPTAVPGEIYLGGAGLARGYRGRPDLTAERFVPDPFATAPGARLYRTGDLGRWLPGGDLDFVGRADQQLKIRGFRIEPGEVERALLQHSQVREAVAGAYQAGTDRRLAAWVVPRGRDEEKASDSLAAGLQDFLRTRLPEPMVPSAIVVLDALPLTPSGKLDRRALPDPERARQGREEDSYDPPRTEIESQLAALWQEVLGAERVGRSDRFLQLGGHSLVAMQLILRIRSAFGIELPLNVLYSSTLEEMAVAVANARASLIDASLLAELLEEVEQMSGDPAGSRLGGGDE